jgi:hypothetical protein
MFHLVLSFLKGRKVFVRQGISEEATIRGRPTQYIRAQAFTSASTFSVPMPVAKFRLAGRG